jgi:hypothetical protein
MQLASGRRQLDFIIYSEEAFACRPMILVRQAYQDHRSAGLGTPSPAPRVTLTQTKTLRDSDSPSAPRFLPDARLQ